MKNWIVILAGITLWGCASSPHVEKLPDTADANEEVQRLQQDMQDANTNLQVDILSPAAWKEASDYQDEAKDRLAHNRSKEKILYSVAEARAWLKKATEHAQQASNVIPDLLQVRQEAKDAQAPQFASNEYDKAESDLREYARDREDSEFGITNDRRTKYREAYINAQTMALQNHYLGEAREAIRDARDKDAKTLVPNVWEDTLRTYRNAQGFIAANRLDEAGIQGMAKKAVDSAKRLQRITNEAIAANHASPEQRALAFDRMKQRNANLSEVLDQQAFDQKYDEARQMFDPKDAEVYKQGNKLILRLKGVQFTTGHSELPASSFPIITKVGSVIKSFGGSPEIRIEGHTDSRGGKAVNERLAQQRAEAVKEYLISNIGIQPEQVQVVAVRDERPIASNKTEEGRAENRRVDVVVMPKVEEGPQIRQAQ